MSSRSFSSRQRSDETLFLSNPNVIGLLCIDQIVVFYQVLRVLKTRLTWSQGPDAEGPPLHLPEDVKDFVACMMDVPDETWAVDLCWDALRASVWRTTDADCDLALLDHLFRPHELLNKFLKYGRKFCIGFHDLYPRTRTCLDPQCMYTHTRQASMPRELSRLISVEVTLFTHDLGPLPVWSYSAMCRKCGTRYYHDHYIHASRSRRSYYPGVPSVIQISTHAFIDALLCERFTNSMVCGWVSATNNARIYELEHRESDSRFPLSWKAPSALSSELIWDAFFLNALLQDCDERCVVLGLDNRGISQVDRLRPALEARNVAMVGPGQEQWNHACNLCCAEEEINGEIRCLRAAVTDGVTVGRPCCGVHDCQGLLPTQRSRFCSEHQAHDDICCITTCEAAVEPGRQTCTDPEHRKLEKAGLAEYTAMFQLRRRLERNKVAHTEDALSGGPGVDDAMLPLLGDELTEVGAIDECAGKSDKGNTKPKARFGRRRTHNEQLCVATCGVILGRATFYGSEGPNGVRMFHHTLFPTKQSLPGVLFYDSACQLKRVIVELNDLHFQHCALPVDVFRMKTKHKESDDFCGRYCNPAMFEDLMVDGKWRFNSSAAEMTNAWFGGFQALVREMRKDRYEFFLDEMIKRRNRIITDDLRRRRHCPFQIPRADLLAV